MRCVDDPTTVTEALYGDASAEWKSGMEEELGVFKNMGTWKPEFLPNIKQKEKTKLGFSRTTDSEGMATRYRARLVAKGLTRTEVVHYEEVFAPVAKYTSLRYLLLLKVLKQYKILQSGCQERLSKRQFKRRNLLGGTSW